MVGFAQPRSFNFEKKDSEDGLQADIVYAFCEDVNGIIWIGTINGISKFDGYKLTPSKIYQAIDCFRQVLGSCFAIAKAGFGQVPADRDCI